MTSNVFHDFQKMDKAQVPASDKTFNKIWKISKKRKKTTKPHTAICV